MPCPTRVLILVVVYYHDPSLTVVPFQYQYPVSRSLVEHNTKSMKIRFQPQNDLIDEVIDDLAVPTMVDSRQEGHSTPEITAMPIPSTARLAMV
ncbi:hypothetical protein FCM35_KLT03721 [Carex littledalei]|uniref:Uncharacterized protein n=1 Tax=Carex littledalei TaxID=544730 RepID=A0A833R118_9POAL|nr:hypothetical protein FCM35_KLT03721 [Carex littledalei]